MNSEDLRYNTTIDKFSNEEMNQ